MRIMFVSICFSLLLYGCSGKASSERVNAAWIFHTTPNKWKKSRFFHTPFDEGWSDRIVVRRTPLTQVPNEKVFSPNKSYWYSLTEPDFTKARTHNLQINIYNERDYLVRLEILDIYGNFKPHSEWINEKLLYVRLWWGRVLGVDFIFDVEKEQIIYKENINDGNVPFLQWQQAKSVESKTQNQNLK